MRVRAPIVGPIVGVVSSTSVKIAARGDEPGVPGVRCWGVARCRTARKGVYGVVKRFDMSPESDLMGVAIFDRLEAATCYEYQIGFVHESRPSNLADLIWLKDPTGSFTTFDDQAKAPVSFLLGSCRYFRRLKSGKFKFAGDNEYGDETFGQMKRQVMDKRRTDLLLMLGDQIYADHGSHWPWSHLQDATFEEYCARYRTAFASENLRWLMARIPTYMTWDDHEITNGWPLKPENGADRTVDYFDTKFFRSDVYRNGVRAYNAYQTLHSPVALASSPRETDYSYSFGCGSAQFFVMDTRNERSYAFDPSAGRWTPALMIEPRQMEKLCDWLVELENRTTPCVKFVVSAVPLFPDAWFHRGDKWLDFAAQREDLLNFIRKNGITRVVVLSGDVHCSYTSVLTHCRDAVQDETQDDKPFKVYNVVSSAFYWYTIGMQKSWFVFNDYLRGKNGRYTRYYVRRLSPVCRRDNFTRITANAEEMTLEVFSGGSGDRLSRCKVAFTC